MEINLETLLRRKHENRAVSPEAREIQKGRIMAFLNQAEFEWINEEFCDMMLDYFSDDRAKGLALLGQKGIGKSFALESYAIALGIKFVTAAELSKAYASGGYSSLDELAYPNRLGNENQPFDLVIDEVGSEPNPASYFGSPLNVIEEVFRKRYILWERYGARTHFSANLPLLSSSPGVMTIERLYGDYIADRVKQMCEIPPCRGRNLRELKK